MCTERDDFKPNMFIASKSGIFTTLSLIFMNVPVLANLLTYGQCY